MPGASRTKQLIAASMKELMKNVPFEKISVSDIVEHAEIGRNTFYYHFRDKYDLVNWIYQTESARYFTEHSTGGDWGNWLEGLEDYFRENKEFYCNALTYSGQNSLQDYMFDTFSDMVVQELRVLHLTNTEHLSADEMRFLGDFLASAAMGLLLRWARDGMREDPHQYRECARRMRDGSLINAYLAAMYPEAEKDQKV